MWLAGRCILCAGGFRLEPLLGVPAVQRLARGVGVVGPPVGKANVPIDRRRARGWPRLVTALQFDDIVASRLAADDGDVGEMVVENVIDPDFADLLAVKTRARALLRASMRDDPIDVENLSDLGTVGFADANDCSG